MVSPQPVSITVIAGQEATFSAAAIGSPAPTVQWEIEAPGATSFTPIKGATSDTYRFVAQGADNGAEYQAVFSNPLGTVQTNDATLTLDQAITTQPKSQVVTAGSKVTFTAAANGNPTVTGAQWQQLIKGKWTNISGATSDSLTVTAPSSPGVEEFRAVFSDSLGKIVSDAAILTVEVAPSDPSTLANVTKDGGQVVTLTASASGTPLAVQWEIETAGATSFTPIKGATSDTYRFVAQGADNGVEYQAVFSNRLGTVQTNDATLTVDQAITTQPKSQAVTAGSKVTFTAAANGNPTVTGAQWQQLIKGKWTNISGATSDSLTVTAPSSPGVEEFRAVFSDSLGKIVSNAAILSVEVAPSGATIQPTSLTVDAGTIVTLSASASGSALSVQWQVSIDGGAFQNIAGATSDTYRFVALASDNGNEYQAVFSNAVGTVTTKVASLTVEPVVITQPSSQTVATGQQDVTFTAAANGNSTVQWQQLIAGKWTKIQGATSATLTETVPSSPGVEEFRAVFTNSLGSANTNPAILTVDAPPVVTTSAIVTVHASSTGTFTTISARATGTDLSVQWQVSTDGGETFTNIVGATSDTYGFKTAAGEGNNNEYQAVFMNPVGLVIAGLSEV